MSGLNIADRLLKRVAHANNQSRAEEWFKKHGNWKCVMFLEQKEDPELEELNEDMQKVFDKLNKKSKGAFYEGFDGYVERDERGKLHLHVFEIDD